MMSSRAKRVWWSRLVAGLLCLCMVMQPLFQRDVVSAYETVDIDDNKMHVMIYDWHAVKEDSEEEPILRPGEKGHEDGKYGAGETIALVTPNVRDGEKFVAFSVSVGQDAAKVSDDGQSVNVTYNPNVHLVKIHAFYSDIREEVAGAEFGEKFEGAVNLEKDTKILDKESYETKFPDKTIDGESIKLYNTDKGLHTDKTAEISELESKFADEDKAGARTFDLKLESWVSNANLANVGLILDASGSMAFTSDLDLDEENSDIVTVNNKLVETFNLKSENGIKWLNQSQVDQILNKNYTSNSKLDYSDYSYFVYDGRSTVQEYAPLAYWDGTSVSAYDGEDGLNEGLIGYYSFDDESLKNLAPGKEKDPAAEGTATNFEDGESKAEYNSETVDNHSGQSLKLYDNDDDTIGKKYDIELDANLSDLKNFTISFAIKTEQAGGDLLGTASYQNILDVIGDNESTRYYSVGRGARGGNAGSSNHVRSFFHKNGEDSTEVLTDQKNILKDTKWHVFTYVVETRADGKTTATMYVDDLAALSNELGENIEISCKVGTVILGGFNSKLVTEKLNGDAKTPGSDILIDEVYIYDRALTSDEVAKLKSANKKSSRNL